MSAYSDIGRAEAEAILAEAIAIGQQFRFWHRDNDPVDLYGVINDLGLTSDNPQSLRSVEVGTVEIIIPNQTGFDAQIVSPTKPITKGDKIEAPIDGGRYFFINDAMQMQGNGFIYIAKGTERKTLTLGTKS